MRNMILLTTTLLLLTSCGMTYEEIEKKKEFCDKNNLEFRVFENFGMRATCETKGQGFQYEQFNEEDKKQIQFCRDNKMNFYESAWDGSINCKLIED